MLTIYQTTALPKHYVAENGFGQRFLLPALPSSKAAWKGRKLYRGNYVLEKSASYIQAMYANADESEGDAEGDEARTESLRIRLSPSEKAELERQATEAGEVVSAYIRRTLNL